MPREAFLLIFHGSAKQQAKVVSDKLITSLAAKLTKPVRCCYLREGFPTLPVALREMAEAGIESIKCLPLLLLPGSHSLEDIPKAIKEFEETYKSVKVTQMGCLAESDFFADFLVKALNVDGSTQ